MLFSFKNFLGSKRNHSRHIILWGSLFLMSFSTNSSGADQRFYVAEDDGYIEEKATVSLFSRKSRYESWKKVEPNKASLDKGDEIKICIESPQTGYFRLWQKKSNGRPVLLAPNKMTSQSQWSVINNKAMKINSQEKVCLSGSESSYDPMYLIKEGMDGRYKMWLEFAQNKNQILSSSFGAYLMAGKAPVEPVYNYQISRTVAANNESCSTYELSNNKKSSNKVKLRIIGGSSTKIEQLPWQLAIVKKGSKKPFCGASLINDRWALTAAHCLKTQTPDGDNWQPSAKDIQIGYRHQNIDNLKTINIKNIIIHPNWNPDPNIAENDIALIKFSNKITENDNKTKPIDLVASQNKAIKVDRQCGVVSGWGRVSKTNNMLTSKTLLKASVELVERNACNKLFSDAKMTPKVSKDQFCAGGNGFQDSCQGDSGGPLVVEPSNSNTPELAGIVSWGYGCAIKGLPGVYTDVNYHRKWIESNIK